MYYSKKTYKSFFITTVCFFLLPFWVSAQQIRINKKQIFPYNITNLVSVYRDTTANLSLKEVQKKVFTKSKRAYLNFPFTNDAHWVQFKLKNTTSQPKDLFLAWSNPLVEQLDFYVSDSIQNHFRHKTQKMITSNREQSLIFESNKISVLLAPNQTKTVFIKVTSKRGHFASIQLYTQEAYFKSRIDSHSYQGFLNGLIVFRLVLIFSLAFFVIRDKTFRFYSFNVFLKSLAYWAYVNILGPLFTDNPAWVMKINFLFYSSFSVGSVLFLLYATHIHKLPKWHTIVLNMLLYSSLFFGVISLFDYQWYWLKAGMCTIVISSVYCLILVIYGLGSKKIIDKFYAIPMCYGFIGTALLFFPLTGLVDYLPLYALSYSLFICEFLVFIFFLGRIIHNSEKEKIISDQQLQLKQIQNAQLKELDVLKTRFFTNISHEFRTPLTLLVGPINDLQKKYPNELILKIMQRNLVRLQNLINQILEISKLEAGEMSLSKQEANLSQFLKQILASFESFAQDKGILYHYSMSDNQESGSFDLDKLEKILTNLLSNAFKFTPQNGRVEVQIIFDKTNLDWHKITIKLEDSGIGIAPERLPYIFDRFYQVDDSNQRLYEGTGIGLALVKELVAVLKGEITVKSELNNGTTFTLTLFYEPLEILSNTGQLPSLNTLAEEVNLEINPFENDPNTPLMLIVEDNQDLRLYMASIFEADYKLILAKDGQEGLEKAIEFVPDIVISDLMMPKLDGLDLCASLKNDERISHIPVIMLTAKATMADKLKGLKQGADDYVSKPFHKEELVLRAANLIQQRQLLQEKYSTKIPSILPKTEPEKEPTLEDLFIEKAQKVINNYLGESTFDVEIFANEMNLSPVQLRRKLKAITNQSSVEYVRNYRLDKASDMLKKGGKTVSEIAYNVGFESVPYFSKMFQERFGKTATEWKQ